MMKKPSSKELKNKLLKQVSYLLSGLKALIFFILILVLSLGFTFDYVNKAPVWGCATVAPIADWDYTQDFAKDLNGQHIFTNRCIVCHSLDDQIVVGPGLLNILQRRDTSWVRNFILDSQVLIASGDSLARRIFQKFDKNICPPFHSDHPKKDLDDLIDYFIVLDSLSAHH